MKHLYDPSAQPTPLPTDAMWLKEFNKAMGDPDKASQALLEKEMQLSYRAGVGELIWAMTTCHPDLAFASVKLSQSNSCPHKMHYPVAVESNEAVFNLVWSYRIKALDARKKAQCTCDESPRLGQVRILDETYANCVNQTSACLFYSIAAAENLLVYGSDVSNAFAEAETGVLYPTR